MTQVKSEVKYVEEKKFEENLADLEAIVQKVEEWGRGSWSLLQNSKKNEIVKRIARYLGSSRENLGQGHAGRWYWSGSSMRQEEKQK